MLLLGTWAWAQPVARFRISPQRVAEALAAAGTPATTGQVRFLYPVTAADRDPALQVMHVGNSTGGTAKAELRCRDHRACLPFFVLLGMSGTTNPVTRPMAAQKTVMLENPANPALMRDGDAATLVFEGSALRITIPVICLQSGNRGQTIRVVSTDHKRFFSAEILSSGLLKAAL